MKIIKLIIIFLLFFNYHANSQNEDVSKYFEDNNLSNVKYLLKVGFDPLNNEFAVSYEHCIGKYGAYEVGAGAMSIKRQLFLYDFGPYMSDVPTSGLAYNLKAEIKLYPYWGFYEKAYISFAGKLNFIGDRKMLDITIFSAGFQTPIYNHLTIDFYGGFGIRIFKEYSYVGGYMYETSDSAFAVPLMVKLGYAF